MKDKEKEFEEQGERISKNERDIKDLISQVEKANRPVFSGKDGVDSSEIEDMLDNWKKEMHTMFARREDLVSLENRVKKLEDEYSSLNETLSDTTSTANVNKEEIEKLKKLVDNKLDSDTFDTEIANLTEAVKNAGGDISKVISSPSNGNFSTKDTKKIKDMLDKFPDLEKTIEELRSKLSEAATKKEMEQMEKEINENYENQLSKISNDLSSLKDLLDLLTKDMDFLKASGGSNTGNGANPEVIINVTNKIEKLEIKL